MRAWKVGLLVLLAQSHALTAFGQVADRDVALDGLGAVNVEVLLSWDQNIPRFDEGRVRTYVQARFERELRAAGIQVSEEAANSLALYLNPVLYDTGLVMYSWRLAFEEMAVPSRTIGDSLLEAFPLFEAAIDTASSPSVPRMRLWGAVETGATWATTWEGTSGVGWIRPTELRIALEARAEEAAREFADALRASN